MATHPVSASDPGDRTPPTSQLTVTTLPGYAHAPMARDPDVQHTTPELCEGLRRVQAGEGLSDSPDLLVELDYLGLVRVNHLGVLQVTGDGDRFLADNP